MKRILIISLFAIAFAACKKTQTNPPATQQAGNKIAGKWTILSVTVIPRDSTGKAINDGTLYNEPSYYYFLFNSDNSWVENLDPALNANIGISGQYVLHADTSFTLINKDIPLKQVECKIVSITDKSLTFTNKRSTLFNGVTPGYLEYVFKVEK